MTELQRDKDTTARRSSAWTKAAVLCLVAIGFTLIYYFFGDQLSLLGLAAKEQQIREFGQEHPVATDTIAFAIYVAVTGLSLPGAAAMTLVIGWYFGFSRGLVLVSFASTTGATLAFLLSRYLFRDSIERRFGNRLQVFNEALQREGAFYLFTLRLIPAVPFFVINVVMGLTKMHTRTFWWVSQLGMLAGTCVFVYAGSAVPNLQTLADRGVGGILTPQLIAAFVVLGVFPLLVKKIGNAMRGRIDESPQRDDQGTATSAS
jgi:uncharacterized membrane protein YdjX (TVP38/TMEM64 family)